MAHKKKPTDEVKDIMKDWDLTNLKPAPMPELEDWKGKGFHSNMPILDTDEDKIKGKMKRLYKKLIKKDKFSRGGGVAMRGFGNATYSEKDI